MSSPNHLQGSYHASSQEAAGDLIDMALSQHATIEAAPGSEVTESRPHPNTQYSQRLSDVHSRSMSPRLHRTPSPSGVSIAQRRIQMAEQLATSAMSGVGEVSQQVRHGHSVAETAISKMLILRKSVEEEIAQICARANASASNVAHALSSRIDQVAARAEQIA